MFGGFGVELLALGCWLFGSKLWFCWGLFYVLHVSAIIGLVEMVRHLRKGKAMELLKGRFTLDGSSKVFEGFYNPARSWNGSVTALFTHEGMKALSEFFYESAYKGEDDCPMLVFKEGKWVEIPNLDSPEFIDIEEEDVTTVIPEVITEDGSKLFSMEGYCFSLNIA